MVTALLELDFDVTVTTGSDEVGSQLRALDQNRVHVCRWVELGPLVRRCDLVVCHGGAGTVLAALAAGVPLLLLPRGAPSQARMSAACEARGVGRAVRWDAGDRGALHDALSEVAASDRIRAAAAAVAAEIGAMPDASTVVPVLAGVT
ncbi:MAG: glycosyltransferase [Acidimicrobiales bacterium]